MTDSEGPGSSFPNTPSDSLPAAERFTFEEQIAVGGQGVVFRGRDRLTGRLVIIKQLRSEFVADPTSVARFLREADALRRLNHPNIVRLLATFEHEDGQAIVMEYVPGGTLREQIDRLGPLPFPQLLETALELADALSRAHHLDILHRDIKPENVLLSESGEPRLTDFGIALLEGDSARLTRTGATPGSPAYMSPETLRGENIDKRSDIWSFGVLLYEMIAGRRPFVGEAATAVMIKILQDPTPDVLQWRPDCPQLLASLVHALLQKDREKRPSSMRLVASALEAIREGKTPEGIDLLAQGSQATPPPQRAEPAKPVEGPALLTSSITDHMPSQTIPFIGRQQELDDLSALLGDPAVRLVTILGPGGIGKTQLGLQAGRASRNAFADGVAFVPLAPLSSAREMDFAIAESIDLHLLQPATVRQQLLDHLQAKELLLILDNFEHLLDGAALVADIVQAAPQVSILVTSRASLNLTFEHLYALHGLAFPPETLADNADIVTYPSVQLLLQQARQVQPDFRPNAAELRQAARIARLVQGMPLAVVLAARWAEMLSMEDIALEITRCLDFLDTTMRDIPARQRSVRAVFESSWNQLSPTMQAVFARLTVFRGGFTRHAALEVAGADLRALLHLVRKSLVSASRRDRYEVHELLRQYGEEQLQASGKARPICDAHSVYYLDFLGQRESDVKGGRQAEALREIETDLQNIRRAWNWALEHKHRAAIGEGLEALHLFYDIRGRYHEGQELFAAARRILAPAAGEEPDQIWGRIVTRYGFLQVLVPSDTSKVLGELELGLALAEKHGDPYEIALAAQALGTFTAVVEQNPQRAAQYAGRARDHFRELGDLFFLARALVNLGLAAIAGSDLQAFSAYLEEAAQVARQGDDIVDVSLCLANLTEYAIGMGQYDKARAYCMEAIDLATELDAPPIVAFSQACLACIDLLQGRLETAITTLNQSLSLAQDIHSLTAMAYASDLSAVAAVFRADYANAARLAREAKANPANNTLGLVLAPWALAMAGYGLQQSKLARDALCQAFDQAQALTFPAPPLWLIPVAALLLADDGQHEQATELLARASTDPLNPPGWMETWTPLRELPARLRRELGAERYHEAQTRGEKLDISAAIDDLLTGLGREEDNAGS